MRVFLRFAVALLLSILFVFAFILAETFTFLGVVLNAVVVTFICKEVAKKFFDNVSRRQQITIAYFLSLAVLAAMFFLHGLDKNAEFMARIIFVYLPTYLMGWLIEDRAASLSVEIKELKFSEFFGFYDSPKGRQASNSESRPKKEEHNHTSSKQKLQELKEMMADGLIDEDDYEKKKREILNSI